MKQNKKLIFLGSIIFTEVFGSLGAIFNLASLDTWYPSLVKPPFNPPAWVFGPVWTLLFLLIGISLALVLTSAESKFKKLALGIFAAQFVLNIAWSYFFFYLRSPMLGLIDITALLVLIALNIYYFAKINRSAAWLLVPYLLWVSFATILNLSILVLN
jgi:translocator protein